MVGAARGRTALAARATCDDATSGLLGGARIWSYLAAAFLALHGIVHAVVVMGAWQIGDVPQPAPTLLPAMPAGSLALRAFGALWLVALVGFTGVAGAVHGSGSPSS